MLLTDGPRVVSLSGNRDIKSKGATDIAAVIESGNCKCQKLDLSDCGIKQAAGEAVIIAVAGLSSFKAISLDKNDFGLKLGTDALPAPSGGKKDRRKTRFAVVASTPEVGSTSAVAASNMAGPTSESTAFLAMLRNTSLTEVKIGLQGPPDLQELQGDLLRIMTKQNASLDEVMERGSANDGVDRMLTFKSRMWRSVPEQVLEPLWLTYLDMHKNFLTGLPYSLLRLKSLTALDVSSNLMDSDSVPLHLSGLKKLKVLKIDDNPFVTWTPDPQAPSVTMAQMRQIGEEKAACMSLRAIVIGQENVGKTTLVDTLYRSLNDEGLMKHQLAKWKKRFQERKEGRQWTDGIEISNTLLPNADPAGSPLSLNIWDFAGQAVYYPTHQLFLPDNAVFIVVFDLSLPSSVARVHYWLDSIASNVSKSPPVLLVGTHKDKCGSNWEEICESVRNRHAGRRDVDVRGVFAIRATQMGDMMAIRQALQNVATTSKIKEWVGRKFPRSYTFLASVIREENSLTRNPIISRAEFRKFAACFGIVEDDQLEDCIAWLSYVGSILIFPRMMGKKGNFGSIFFFLFFFFFFFESTS